MKKRDLFEDYLINVNHIDYEENKKTFRAVRNIDNIIIFLIASSLSIMTIWAIAQEVYSKLRF